MPAFCLRPVVLEYLRHIFPGMPHLFTESNVLTPSAPPCPATRYDRGCNPV